MANSYLSRTPSSAGNRQKWTWSAWVKFSQTPGAAGATLFSAYAHGNDNFNINLGDTNQISMRFYNGTEYQLVPNRRFRDFSAWYHLVFAVDTTLATAADRFKIYVNGVRETSFSNEDQPTQNLQMTINDTTTMQIGRYSTGSNFFDGYMSHVSLVDGQALTPTSFGETDSTSGIWKFKSPSGLSWGTNGVHLKFENSGNLGLDSSGQTNNFTVNGNLKQALDTPSNVYATFNPLIKTPSGLSFSHGDTTLTTTNSQWEGCATTLAPSSGKWYWEAKYNTGSGIRLDIARLPVDLRFFDNSNQSYLTYAPYGYGYQLNNSGYDYYGNNNSMTQWTSNRGNSTKIYMVAVDLDNGKWWIGADGNWFNKSGTANPVTGADPLHDFSANLNGDPWLFGMSVEGSGGSHNANFGNGHFGTTAITSAGSNGNGSLFEYDVPSGYYALNTKNLNTYG